MAEKIVRVGGVGTGRIFSWGHLRIYPKLLDRARLVAFYDNQARTGPRRRRSRAWLRATSAASVSP